MSTTTSNVQVACGRCGLPSAMIWWLRDENICWVCVSDLAISALKAEKQNTELQRAEQAWLYGHSSTNAIHTDSNSITLNVPTMDQDEI